MLKKNMSKYLSLALSVLMLLTILPTGVFAQEHSTDNTIQSFDCDYCERGQIVNRSKRDEHVLSRTPCGHSSQCQIEKTQFITQSWTECTTSGCYHSPVSVHKYTDYIHTRCGR